MSPAHRARILSMKDAPEAIRRLPEPLRTKALEAANELLAEDADLEPHEACRRAIDAAWDFRASRMPFARTPEEGGED